MIGAWCHAPSPMRILSFEPLKREDEIIYSNACTLRIHFTVGASSLSLALCIPQQQKNKCTHKPFLHFNPRIKHQKRLMACQTKRSQIGLIWSQLLFGSELCKTISTINKPLEPLYAHLSSIQSAYGNNAKNFHIAPGLPFNIIIVGESALEALWCGGTSLE